jgi:hypothetical protein
VVDRQRNYNTTNRSPYFINSDGSSYAKNMTFIYACYACYACAMGVETTYKKSFITVHVRRHY